MSNNKKNGSEFLGKKSILQHTAVRVTIVVTVLLMIASIFLFVDLKPSLSHLNVSILSGSKKGNYFAIAKKAANIARKQKGVLKNISTKGSLDNIEQLARSAKAGKAEFALVQNGMPWGKDTKFELIAHLTKPETVFFLGLKADKIRQLSDIKGMRIGIGPKGSGTAQLALKLFKIRMFAPLKLKLSFHTITEQMKLIKKGKLDLGMFVIAQSAAFIKSSIQKNGLQIASFHQTKALAQRIPFLKSGHIYTGYYDPVRNLPPEDKTVLQVETLILSNGNAKRSQIVAMLSLLSKVFPNLITYNKNTPNTTGLTIASSARDFYNNQGPEILDKYAPRIMDIIPLSNLIQLVMVISILFNLMNASNRFFVWRIDSNRVKLENKMKEFFGPDVLFSEIEKLAPLAEHNQTDKQRELDLFIDSFAALEKRCRKQSQTMLVPMGGEMLYRYQEGLIHSRLLVMRAYRQRLTNG